MRTAPILALLLAGCGQGGQQADSPAAPPVQTATLTGLYESGASARPSQLCIVERDGSARFGLVTWQSGAPGCSGAGSASREGYTLRLDMEGDEPCRIEARIAGTAVLFPADSPASCAYYCAPAARLGALAFDKVGGAEADALRARDLAGGALCD